MNIRGRVVKKIAIGVVLILLASLLTVVIKDIIAMQEPENSLPIVTITYNGEALPKEHIVVGAYSWRFLTTAAEGTLSQEELYEVVFAPVLAGAPVSISFSYPCQDVRVSMAQGKGPFVHEDFVYLSETDESPQESDFLREKLLYLNEFLITPTRPGEYVYRVEGYWGYRGSVLYYFKIRV